MRKIVRICLISLILGITFFLVFCITFASINYVKYQSIALNTESLTNQALSISIYDKENKPMKENNQFNGDFCKIEDLNPYTYQAFLAIEDKEFFNHNGLNKKRIAKAIINNIKSASLKEGASTISQQLIKNTHLSNEKTFERKLKEMALTKKLEASFTKQQILESYLNIIFFGNNCYGIESASQYFFNKNASDLSLEESCTLAGIIKSPSKYSPITHYENCLKRRNLVLSEMEKDGYIKIDEKIVSQNKPINLQITPRSANKLNSYTQASIDEASKLLNLPAKQLAICGYKIHTYCDENKQAKITEALEKNSLEDIDCSGIVIDGQTLGVSAYYAKSNYKLIETKRQPASCLKPLLVYSPALNEGVVSPATQVLDEPLKIGDYQPTNVNKKFLGYVSVTDAVKNSMNIPSIKVLSYVGIDTAKQYAEKMGINFDEKDSSYVLALGGMTYGVNLKQLSTAYTVFVNKGEFDNSHFVQYITDKNNKLVYIHKPQPKMVLRDDSAYLMTNILQETAKSGTARKLSEITNTEIASKTGTVGNKEGNTDAYNISYTPTEVIGVWFGDPTNQTASIAGGNQPTTVVRDYVKTQNYEKTKFDIPSTVTEAKIDSLEKEENHTLVLASPYSPERYIETALFSRFNLPTETSTNFTEKPQIHADCKVENNQILINLKCQKHIEYQILKNNVPYQTIRDKQENMKIRLKFSEKDCTIIIKAKYVNTDNFQTEKNFSMSKTEQTKPDTKSKWYV